MRLLPAIRLSLETDETTSPERQMDKIQMYARMGDHELVQIGPEDYDLDVSGAVSPFDRPGLGKWLKDDHLGLWDGICVAKLDRLTRSLLDFETFVRWLQSHGKVLVCLDPQIDLSTAAGRVFAQVIVSFAQYEREVIGQRVQDAYRKLQADGKYMGGQVPFGYVTRKTADGWIYEADPEFGPVVAEMCDRYIRYESLGAISRWLNETGVPSPRDAMRKRNGKELRGTRWTTATVRTVLKGPAILGAAVHADGEPVRDSDGVVVYRAEALVSRDVWERIQARLRENPSTTKVNTSALVQVAFCTCGGPMYATTTTRGKYAYRYYHCGNARIYDGERKCQARRMDADRLESAVFGALLDFAGDRQVVERRMIAGRDYSDDIARLGEQIGHLSSRIAVGKATRQDVSADQAALGRAQVELDRLASLEPVPARIEPVETGQMFQARWESFDTVARNQFMRSAGIRAVASRDEIPPPLMDFSRPVGERTMFVVREKDLDVVVHLGSLPALLERASAT